mgnify:CR=1 FL=1
MATKTFNSRDVDRLLKWGIGGLLSIGLGMALLVAAAIFGSVLLQLVAYVAIVAGFMFLGYMSWPAFKR